MVLKFTLPEELENKIVSQPGINPAETHRKTLEEDKKKLNELWD